MPDFRVGFGRTNITPEGSMPLSSYGNPKDRWSNRNLGELYFTAFAFSDDEQNTLIIMTYDITQVNTYILNEIRKRVFIQYDIPEDWIHLCGTHTHSSVEVWFDHPDVKAYNEYVISQGVKAVTKALYDRKKAKMFGGETATERMNFVRHYYREDGTVMGDNYGSISQAPVVRHTTEADPTMRVVKIERVNDDDTPAQSLYLVNWQAHNHLTGGTRKYDLSADFSRAMCNWIESRHEGFATFFQGCAGNLNETSRIPGEDRTRNYLEYGMILADYVDEALSHLTEIKTGPVRSITWTYTAKINHSRDDKAAHAKEVQEFWQSHGWNGRETAIFAQQFGINSVYQAGAILNIAKMGESQDVEMSAYRIGDLGWSAVPFEMFCDTGEDIRKNSPFPMTFTQGYTDNNYSYLPTRRTFEYGSYESDVTRWCPGMAEDVGVFMGDMLNDLWVNGHKKVVRPE